MSRFARHLPVPALVAPAPRAAAIARLFYREMFPHWWPKHYRVNEYENKNEPAKDHKAVRPHPSIVDPTDGTDPSFASHTPHARWIMHAPERLSAMRAPEAPIWADFLVTYSHDLPKTLLSGETLNSDEIATARLLRQTLGFRIQEPIVMTNSDWRYITLFTANGPLKNGNKVAGILPRIALLAGEEGRTARDDSLDISIAEMIDDAIEARSDDEEIQQFAAPHSNTTRTSGPPGSPFRQGTRVQASDKSGRSGENDPRAISEQYACVSAALLRNHVEYLPFFPAPDITAGIAMAETRGGTFVREIEADGQVAILRDPLGTLFAIYNRTDDPDMIKPGTELWNDHERL